ncbi:MAG: MBL fold metallo-hydrolase [Acidobacteria bacterium]|nr:MBL fold metallo-hydrolase [Acidobacteriota bacterium]MBV8890807.1 MBL fold metallo-hydrolase [Acidobacteriota bacterium]MBV9481133.1 MBL fold metallo-hydrolase [Acidobacteriota bacterium]
MIKSTLNSRSLRRRAGAFTKLIRHSAVTPRTGAVHKPMLVNDGELGLTFIGHSSFFIQMAGQNTIIDPNFARWLFVLKRLRKPGVRVTDLPAIDLVLVTHAHFDHLHRPSLRAIAQETRRKSGRGPIIVVPHHVFDLVSDLGFEDVIEVDWWNSCRHGALTVTHVPSRHWGARILNDSHRGYGGYVLRDHKHSLYHAGDTAYFSGFREIGRRLAPKVALLPIGAYNPPQFRNVHTDPADATRAFLDLNARWMIPMHYGTFRLSQEPIEEPLELLKREAAARGIEDRVVVLEEGVTRFF